VPATWRMFAQCGVFALYIRFICCVNANVNGSPKNQMLSCHCQCHSRRTRHRDRNTSTTSPSSVWLTWLPNAPYENLISPLKRQAKNRKSKGKRVQTN